MYMLPTGITSQVPKAREERSRNMQCPQCEQQNPPQAKFCLECGVRLVLVCTQCSTALPAGAKFCLECGQPVDAPPTASSRFTAPEAYTPTHLAEKILTSRSALEGERKQVTVLFADLKGSMELLADRDPEEARRLLDPVLERLMTAVHHYEGMVNQVMGDGIMALFGAPLAHEDHAVRACYAALHMQEAIGRYAEELRRQQGLDVQIRVGLNSGEVVVRAIGSDLHMDYTAVGQTTHLAARLEQLARPGTSLLAADTLRLVEGYVEVAPLGPVPVKGLQEPIEVYELLRAGLVRSRLQAAAARGLTRFVGRDPELKQPLQAWERARAGQGQVVAVIGEPGVGKSRLFYEFTHSHRTHGWLLLASSSVSYGKATPYLPVIDLLKAYFGIEVHDDARKRREKVTGKLLTLERALEPTLPAFLALLEVLVEDQQWQALDPQQRRQRTLDAFKRLLLRESQVQPLCVVFEDLHWIDAETQAVLDSLLDSLPTARILLLVNYRPEYQHGWGAKTYYTQLRLDPLPPASADALLAALLGHAPGLEPLTRLLITRTQGNPFFLEESVRTLVETGVLVGERGAYGLTQVLPTIQVPATVQAVLAARIDRLPPEDKRLLQTAAVIGTEVSLPLLQAIAEAPEEALHRSLTHLQAAEFLYETRLFPEHAYTFKHALTHEVAYGSLLQERRRALHARIVEALERLAPDHLAEQVERLTHHAFRGEVWEKAVAYSRQSGAKAITRAAYREAVAYFEQALEALPRLPKHRDTREQAIDLRLDLRNALFPLGDFGRILDLLREAENLAEALGDQGRSGQVASFMTAIFSVLGDSDRALASGQRALSIAEALGDSIPQVRVCLVLGRVHYSLGDYRRAVVFLGRTVAALTGELLYQSHWGPGLPSVHARAVLVWCQAELGVFAEAVVHGEEGVRIAEAVDHPYSLIEVYAGLGLLYLRKGELHQARAALERGLSIYQVWPSPLHFSSLASPLGLAYALDERIAEALPLLEQAVEQDTAIRLMARQSLRVASLSEGYLLAGRLEEAHTRAVQALDLARTYKERGHEAWVLRLLGEIAAHGDPPQVEPAEAYYCQALTLADDLGMRPLLAHCHYGLGALYLKAGRLEPARLELTAAIALYRAMDMTFWLPQAEAALAQVEGP
jgi:class 3 adenylate cyclase/tetratricopeptide (TPR) repeat protein